MNRAPAELEAIGNLLVADAGLFEDCIEDLPLRGVHHVPVHLLSLQRYTAVGEKITPFPAFFPDNFSFDQQHVQVILGCSMVDTGLF